MPMTGSTTPQAAPLAALTSAFHTGCLSDEDFAKFSTGWLDPAARRTVEAHLAECRSCRDEAKWLEDNAPRWDTAEGHRRATAYTERLQVALSRAIEQRDADQTALPAGRAAAARWWLRWARAVGRWAARVSLPGVLVSLRWYAVLGWTAVVAGRSGPTPAILTAAMLVLLLITLEWVLDHVPPLAARMLASRLSVTGIVGAVAVVAGGYALYLHPLAWPVALRYAVPGVLAGVVLREAITRRFFAAVCGATTPARYAVLPAAVAGILAVVPMSAAETRKAGALLAGLGLGVIGHLLVRTGRYAHAVRRRREQTIVDACVRGAQRLRPVELHALRAYAARRWGTLDQLWRAESIPPVGLTLACALRKRQDGDYDDALALLRRVHDRPGHDPELSNLVRLQEALNYADLARPDEMFEALDEAERLNPQCVVTLVTSALRQAELIPIDDAAATGVRPTTAQQSTLAAMWRALELHERRPSRRLCTLVAETVVPGTQTFLLDSHAYVLLKCGRLEYAHTLLLHCIAEDPAFSSPYLHLGEWYLVRSRQLAVSPSEWPDEAARLTRLATFCLHIAVQLERRKQSLIARRATALLEHAQRSAPREHAADRTRPGAVVHRWAGSVLPAGNAWAVTEGVARWYTGAEQALTTSLSRILAPSFVRGEWLLAYHVAVPVVLASTAVIIGQAMLPTPAAGLTHARSAAAGAHGNAFADALAPEGSIDGSEPRVAQAPCMIGAACEPVFWRIAQPSAAPTWWELNSAWLEANAHAVRRPEGPVIARVAERADEEQSCSGMVSDGGHLVGMESFEGQLAAFTVSSVPEPSLYAMTAAGCAALGVLRVRRRRVA